MRPKRLEERKRRKSAAKHAKLSPTERKKQEEQEKMPKRETDGEKGVRVDNVNALDVSLQRRTE